MNLQTVKTAMMKRAAYMEADNPAARDGGRFAVQKYGEPVTWMGTKGYPYSIPMYPTEAATLDALRSFYGYRGFGLPGMSDTHYTNGVYTGIPRFNGSGNRQNIALANSRRPSMPQANLDMINRKRSAQGLGPLKLPDFWTSDGRPIYSGNPPEQPHYNRPLPTPIPTGTLASTNTTATKSNMAPPMPRRQQSQGFRGAGATGSW